MGDSNSNGEEKLIAVARHIAKTLGHSDTMTDDILNIFSTFDNRFSREKLTSDINIMSDSSTNPHAATLEDRLSSLDHQISLCLSFDRPIWFDSTDSSSFIDSVDELIATIRYYTPLAHENKSVSAMLDRADDLLQNALFRLQEEFRGLILRGAQSLDLTTANSNHKSLEDDDDSSSDDNDDDQDYSIPVAHPVTDFNIIIDSLPSSTINDLHEIVKRMVAVDYGRECSHVYSACRRDFLEESLSRLGLHKFSTEEVQKLPWPELEDEIDRWCKSALLSCRILFPSERRLCDRVFFGFSATADFSFMEVCRGSAIQLLNFADAVAISSRSPERLFKVLDVYETLRDLMPDFELLFSDKYCVFLRNEAITIWKRVGEAIRRIFMELENLIQRDPVKVPVPGGGLHPITRYVMNYLRAACKAQQTLEQVFEEDRERDRGMLMSGTSSLSAQLGWIMQLLESNLEAKSKIYRDIALSSVFMMNNGRYIVQKVEDCELGMLLGEDWIRKYNVKVRQFHVSYQRSTWNKVVGILKVETGAASLGGPNARPFKERLKLFNSHFEEVLKVQSAWVVFDDHLRDELKNSVTGTLLPAYRNFIGRFQNSPEAGRNPEKHIKYSVEDVEARINSELFLGNGVGRR
ncbi:exocyst complex component EXO70B1 [Silene latifolia]|uniref:exocyst complex component EXO70B1 n=1 Tax=Silene latifolia TaxID=37657 RepID=UPI003D7780AA